MFLYNSMHVHPLSRTMQKMCLMEDSKGSVSVCGEVCVCVFLMNDVCYEILI